MQLADVNRLFGKSLYIRRDLPKGHVLSMNDVSLKKPGTGIPAKRLNEVLGKTLTKSYQSNEQLRDSDFE